MNRQLESEVTRQAVHALVVKDPRALIEDPDWLKAGAKALGVQRSTLGLWLSPKPHSSISMEGVRLIAQTLQLRGCESEARLFVQRMLCNPLGLKLAPGMQSTLWGQSERREQ